MKTKRIITTAVTTLAILMVILSGVMKLMQGELVVTTLTKVGVGPYIIMLGLMEIGFATLFLFPKTMKLGFILLSCYFAGAMAVDLSHGGSLLNAAITLALIWVAAFLRDRFIFLSRGNEKQIAFA